MTYTGNRYLTLEEMTVNARFILSNLTSKGWSKNSVCGMLGNMETESTINSGIWEGLNSTDPNNGYGLVQWTPSTKYTDWANANGYTHDSYYGQLQRLQYEIDNGLQWISTAEYPMTFQEFKVSYKTPEYLADVFLKNYERPADTNQPNRQTQARYWYDSLSSSQIIGLLLTDALNGWKW